MADDTISVIGAKKGVVGFWEIDPAHPEGEVFVTDSKAVDVAETAGVLEALSNGRLIKANKSQKAAADQVTTQREENEKIEAERVRVEAEQAQEAQAEETRKATAKAEADAKAATKANADAAKAAGK